MKICSRCDVRYDAAEFSCPQCGFRPQSIDGYPAHAPQLAQESASGFAPEEFALLASLEEQSFWFRGRNKLIIAALHRYCDEATSMLEIGCGTGFVLHAIAQAFPNLTLYGSEVAVAGLEVARRRNGGATLFQMDICNIPYADEFDVIGAFDVLEHVSDDARATVEIFKALKPGGRAIISVPQHMFLWSAQDHHARHYRRYAVDELQRRLENAGFRIDLKTSFVTILLPALFLSRRVGARSDAGDGTVGLRLPQPVNRIFEWTLDAERKLIDFGLRLPAGGSQLIVASKPVILR